MTYQHPYQQLWEFQTTFNLGHSHTPHLPSNETDEGRRKRTLRKDLLAEEYQEYLDAEANDDIVGIADALGDMMYIILGTAVEYGIPLDEVFNEIHRSNMSKVGEDGKPIYREDGKLLKGPNYSPPDLVSIIEQHRKRLPKI